MNITSSGGRGNQLAGGDIVNDRRVSVDVRFDEIDVSIGTVSVGPVHVHVTFAASAIAPVKRAKKKAE